MFIPGKGGVGANGGDHPSQRGLHRNSGVRYRQENIAFHNNAPSQRWQTICTANNRETPNSPGIGATSRRGLYIKKEFYTCTQERSEVSLVPIRNLARRGDYLQIPLLGISVNADFGSATEKRSGIGVLHNEANYRKQRNVLHTHKLPQWEIRLKI